MLGPSLAMTVHLPSNPGWMREGVEQKSLKLGLYPLLTQLSLNVHDLRIEK